MHLLTSGSGFQLAATNDATSSVAFWTMAGVVCLILLVGVSARLVGRNERAVVSRSGRVVRVSGPGLAARIPVLEKVTLVSSRPVDLPLVLRASTRDGVQARILVTAVCRVTDPAGSTIVDDPYVATAKAVERRLQQKIGEKRLDEVVSIEGHKRGFLPALLSQETAVWGVEVMSLRLDAVEVELTPSSLQAIRTGAHQQSDTAVYAQDCRTH